jgi:hypothetical protein
MPTIAREHQLFIKIDQFSVIICRQCQHAVWPSEVEQHLKGKHHLSKKDAQHIQTAIQQWDGLEYIPTPLELPTTIDDPIPEIKLHHDGLLCQREPSQCYYITRSIKVMKQHWRDNHQWSARHQKGRPSEQQQERVAIAMQASFHPVSCQRLFPSRYGSQYIQVRDPRTTITPEAEPEGSANGAAQLISQLREQYRQAPDRPDPIQARELDEANPWLRRTQWAEYLQDLDHQPISIPIAGSSKLAAIS